MHAWIDAATLIKTQSLEGGLVARKAAGLSFLPDPGEEVAFVPPQFDVPRRARVLAVQDRGDESFLVHFEGIDTIKDAERIVGLHCLVRRSAHSNDAPLTQEPTQESVCGFELYDAEGSYVGTIVGASSPAGQSLLKVDCGQCNIVLVPYVDELVREIDLERKTLHLDIAPGLLEL